MFVQKLVFFREHPDAYCVSKGYVSVVGPMLTGLFFEAFRILPEKPAKVCQVCQGLFKFRQPVFPVPFFGSNHFLLRRLGHFFVVYGGIYRLLIRKFHGHSLP